MKLRIVKLVVVLFFAWGSSLYADSDKGGKSSDLVKLDDETVAKYRTALTYFKNKDYQKSYKLFDELFENNLNDPNINFYLGRSAFELKKYHDAIIAFDRVLFEKPDSLRAKLEMARAYFLTNALVDAKKLFKELKATPNLPANLVKVIDKYIEAVEGKEQRHSFAGVMIAGFEYDDNTNSKSDNEIYNNVYIPALATYLDMNNSTEEDDAWAYQLIGLINYAYKVNDEIQNKHDIMMFMKGMFDSKYDSKDIKLVSYTPALSVTHSEKLTFDYALFIDNLWIDNVNTLRSFGMLPKFTYKYNDKTTLNGHLKYQIKKNQQTVNQSKDSKYVEVGAVLSYVYSKKFTATLGAVLSNENKDKINTEIIDNNSYALNFGGNYIYSDKLFIAPLLSIKHTNYDDIDPSYLKKKKNKEYKAGVTATYVYSPKTIVQAGLNFTKQDSNVQPDVYSKYIFTLNFVRPF